MKPTDEQFTQPAHKRQRLSECQKKYIFSETALLTSNKYYLPDQLQQHANCSEEDIIPSESKKPKIPPIFLHNVNNYQAIYNDLKTITANEFTTQHRTNGLKINLSTFEDYRIVTKFYDDQQLQYHTYHNPDKPTLEVVLRNVPISISIEEIHNELNLEFPILKVTRLLNKNKSPTPLCSVQLTKNNQAKEIYKVDRLMNSIISVEPRRKSANIPQCTKCQRYGHTKNYCRLEARCVKCDGMHHYSECRKKQGENPKCVNCGESHSANYKGCSYYQSIKNKNNRQTVPENINQRFREQTPNLVNNGTRTHNPPLSRSYANVTRNDNRQTQNITSNDHTNNLTDIILTKVLEFVQPILNQIKDFLSNLMSNLLSSNSLINSLSNGH